MRSPYLIPPQKHGQGETQPGCMTSGHDWCVQRGLRKQKPETLCPRKLQNHPVSEVILSLDFKDIFLPKLKSWLPKRTAEHKITEIKDGFILSSLLRLSTQAKVVTKQGYKWLAEKSSEFVELSLDTIECSHFSKHQ